MQDEFTARSKRAERTMKLKKAVELGETAQKVRLLSDMWLEEIKEKVLHDMETAKDSGELMKVQAFYQGALSFSRFLLGKEREGSLKERTLEELARGGKEDNK